MPRNESSSRPSRSYSTPSSFGRQLPSLPLPSPRPYVPRPLVPLPSVPKPATFGQVVKEGFGFGIGTSVARNMVDSFFGPKPATPSTVGFPTAATGAATPKEPCDAERKAFETCMRISTRDEHCGNEQMAYSQCIKLNKLRDVE